MGNRKEKIWEGLEEELRLFDALVWTVAGYGVEIWG